MNSYIFDTEDIFKVREGLIGIIDDNQAFMLRYPNVNESAQRCEHACPTKPYKAIFVDGNPVHKAAQKPVTQKIDQKVNY